jgi:hypothetical protein
MNGQQPLRVYPTESVLYMEDPQRPRDTSTGPTHLDEKRRVPRTTFWNSIYICAPLSHHRHRLRTRRGPLLSSSAISETVPLAHAIALEWEVKFWGAENRIKSILALSIIGLRVSVCGNELFLLRLS